MRINQTDTATVLGEKACVVNNGSAFAHAGFAGVPCTTVVLSLGCAQRASAHRGRG
jgi:hypothetical protein